MNFKRYHVSKNLFDAATAYGSMYNDGVVSGITYDIYKVKNYFTEEQIGKQITLTIKADKVTSTRIFIRSVIQGVTKDSSSIYEGRTGYMKITVTPQSTSDYWRISYGDYEFNECILSEFMLNTGSQPLPYEPYSSEVWHDIPHYIHKTDTDTLTTLPAVLYPNDTTATVGLKGDMEQSSQPSPTTPIQPQECGDLETEGAKAGQYKIPILSGGVTTPVYLGEVQSIRRIKKLVLTGGDDENWNITNNSKVLYLAVSDFLKEQGTICYCTHYKTVNNVSSADDVNDGECTFNDHLNWLYIKDSNYTSAQGFKNYLVAQYAAGTPVCVWYVLATPQTAVVNEPIRKIGTYADEVSGITIPTIAGANTISIGTTLQPSEVSVNYHGWHSVLAVHERESGAWD